MSNNFITNGIENKMNLKSNEKYLLKNITINNFNKDVYVGVDKYLLKEIISKITANKLSKDLNLNRDTVERWYRQENRAIPIYALKYLCKLTKTDCNLFNVLWIGGRGRFENRIVPFINQDLAYFLGVIVGDGHLYDNRVVISSDKRFIKEVMSPFCKKLFKIKIITRKIDSWYITEINSRALVWFLRDIFGIPIGRKVHIISIPKIILKNDELIPSFLKGLYDADGSISKSGMISFCSISITLINEVENLMRDYCIKLHLKIDNRGKNPVYHLRCYNKESRYLFNKIIGFKHPMKHDRLTHLCSL